tara:strand:+ start:8792 stop:9694 length:903 start_codon:yes stop_codon:yes gene_type:complete
MANTEHAELSAQFVNQNFVRKLEEGRVKEAQDEGSRFIRSKLRQDSFAREIINPVELGPDEIDRDENTDQPKKIVEKEPDSTATYVTFKGAGQRTWFRGPRYAVQFGKVESQHFVKSKFELMTYQNDIRKILTDNSVKDMADQEDQKFKDTLDAIITANAAQELVPAGGLNAANVADGVKLLLSKKIPVGKLLMSKELYYDALKLPATSVGDQVASRHYDDGVEAEEKLFGFPVVTTVKSDIIANNEMWIFGPENYLGNFFLLQDATLFIKQEADIIEFWSYSAPGIGIGNTDSVVKVTL